MQKLILVFFLLICTQYAVYAQKPTDKNFKKAEKLLDLGDFSKALPLYVNLIDVYPNNGYILYGYAVCIIEMKGSEDKGVAVPYLEEAMSSPDANDLPKNTYFYAGLAYRYAYKFDKAVEMFEKFRALFQFGTPEYVNAQDLIRACNNAKLLVEKPVECVLQNLEAVNSEYDEFSPVVSADESKLMFSSTKHPEGVDEFARAKQTYEYVYETKMQGFNWLSPEFVEFNTEHNIGTSFLSADGQELLLYIGAPGTHNNRSGDIYLSKLEGYKWTAPVKLGDHINSKDWEGSASITPDGNTMFFSRESPDGHGGSDIYKVLKDAKGKWGIPENQGGVVNTTFNEDAPFIHPDGKTLYFHSNSMNSMGGYDIFKTTWENGRWTTPVNMGHPINSPYDEFSFAITADGQKAYYSSNRPSGLGGQDIYKVLIPNLDVNIPLTMIKGRVLDGTTYEAIPTKIMVFDKSNGEMLEKVYNPNTETGDYLIILPPGKNYDMVISAKGYKNHNINIYVPNQTYFYELYQEILLNPVLQGKEQVGEEIVVRNAFYDTKKQKISEAGATGDAAKAEQIEKERADLFELVNTIASSDKKDEVKLEAALTKVYFAADQNELTKESYANALEGSEETKKKYVYKDLPKEEIRVMPNGDTLKILPTLLTSKKTEAVAVKKDNTRKTVPTSSKSTEIALPEVKTEDDEILFFSQNDKALDPKSLRKLDKVVELLLKDENLGVLLEGHTTTEGDGFLNLKLAQERAIKATSYVVSKGIDIGRIRVKAYGEMRPVDEKDGNNPTNNRVEMTMYRLK